MLEGIDVCPIAWYTIMGVSRATYYRWKVNASNGMCADQHGNVGMVKPRIHTLQATATLQLLLEQSANHMSHKNSRDWREGCIKMPFVIFAVEGFSARVEHY
jgi:hypothetical protein